MSDNKVKISLVTLKQPCTACLITGNLIREMLEKVGRELDYAEIEYVELDSLKAAHSVDGLEVESLPAVLINNEQITAGSLPMKNQLISLIQMEAGHNE